MKFQRSPLKPRAAQTSEPSTATINTPEQTGKRGKTTLPFRIEERRSTWRNARLCRFRSLTIWRQLETIVGLNDFKGLRVALPQALHPRMTHLDTDLPRAGAPPGGRVRGDRLEGAPPRPLPK